MEKLQKIHLTSLGREIYFLHFIMHREYSFPNATLMKDTLKPQSFCV